MNGTVHGSADQVDGVLSDDPALSFSLQSEVPVSSSRLDFVGAPYSLECWFRPTDIDGTYRMLFEKDSLSATRETYGVYFIDDSTADGGLVFERWISGTKTYAWTAARSVALKTWHHVVATFDGQQLSLYLDGVVASSAKDPRPSQTTGGAPFRIAGVPQSDMTVIGGVDEVAVYDKALPPERIAAHFDARPR